MEERIMDTCENRLWVIEFTVKGVGKGCAVVKAKGPAEAERILVTQGMFNGDRSRYNITRIEEIVPSPEPMLLAEQLAEVSDETIYP